MALAPTPDAWTPSIATHRESVARRIVGHLAKYGRQEGFRFTQAPERKLCGQHVLIGGTRTGSGSVRGDRVASTVIAATGGYVIKVIKVVHAVVAADRKFLVASVYVDAHPGTDEWITCGDLCDSR